MNRTEAATPILNDSQTSEDNGLCDGCDGTDTPVMASDDGRGQFCPICLLISKDQ